MTFIKVSELKERTVRGEMHIDGGASLGGRSFVQRRMEHREPSPYSDALAVWEAGDLAWPVTWKFLSPEHKWSPFYEYKVLKVGAQ